MSGDDRPRLTLAEIGPRHFEILELGVAYRLEVPGANLSFEVDHVSRRQGELVGELVVRCDLLGTDAVNGVLSHASFNVSSARARSERAASLSRQLGDASVPMSPLLEDFCQRVLTAEQTGEPAVRLKDIARPDPSEQLLSVFGFKLPRHHDAIIFGDGGSAKSFLSLQLRGKLAHDGYRMLLCDWELDGPDHRDRYESIFGDDMPANFFYVRCDRPLTYEVDRLRRIVRDEGIDFVICDSIGYACHTKPEDAEAALAYFRAARRIHAGKLHLAHINRQEAGDQKPFGSAFFHNSARATWNLKATENGPEALMLGVFNRKHNLAQKQAPFAIAVQFGPRTTFTLCDIGQVAEFAASVPLPQRVRASLRAGARTREQLAAEFADEKAETLRRTIDREIEKGRLVRFPGVGGVERIGLAAREASS